MLALVIPMAFLAAGCSMFDPVVPPPQEVLIRVEADPGKPVKGADLFFNGQKIANTDDTGARQAAADRQGRRGVRRGREVPGGLRLAAAAAVRDLAQARGSRQKPEYSATCPPTTRLIVVAVRAEGGPNLPVMYLGREVARTDPSGAAHVLLRLRPDEQFDLLLDTNEKGNERLRPQNPRTAFFVKQKDDVFTFDQKFALEPIRRVVVKGRPPPTKIQ